MKSWRMKRICIILWMAVSSVFLWLISIAIITEKGISNYCDFCILLFGGGLAYHVFSELLTMDCNDKNSRIFSNFSRTLILISVGYLIAIISFLIGKAIGLDLGKLIFSIGCIIGLIWIAIFSPKILSPVKHVLFSKEQKK